jgi:hypothetical protein
MSSFKRLNKADVTTTQYAANKRWVFNYNTIPNDTSIVYYQGKNEPFAKNGSTTTNGEYQSLIFASMNHMFYQSYSGSLLNTGSLMFNVDTYASASQNRPTASYFDYNINPLLTQNFPTASNSTIGVINVNHNIFGTKILPYSFNISSSQAYIIDDGNGNLYGLLGAGWDDYILTNYISASYFLTGSNSSSISHVGNIFYAHGIAILTNQSGLYQNIFSSPSSSISFQNEHIIYENEVRCIIKESEYNLSYNPTLLSGSYTTGSLKDFTQGIAPPIYSYSSSSLSSGTITAGGTDIGNHADDTITSGISIGFDFNFYGTNYSTCNLSSDGNLQFITNYTTNIAVFTGPTLFPFLTDLETNGSIANPGIYTQTIGTSGNRIFTAEWKANYTYNPEVVNFQIRLYEGTNTIEFVYGTINNSPNGPYSVISGIQKDALNTGYAALLTVPSSGTIIRYTLISSAQPPFTFAPYATTIGLYNDDNELLMVAKLGKPIMLSPDTDTTFIVKYDT